MTVRSGPNPPYNARIHPVRFLNPKPADPVNDPYANLSQPIKVYFVDLVGRQEPARHEWQHSGIEKEAVQDTLQQVTRTFRSVHHGVPFFAVSFPHVTKMWRFGNPFDPGERESNTYFTGGGETENLLATWSLSPREHPEAFCAAESYLHEWEMDFWRTAVDVKSYLRQSVVPGVAGRDDLLQVIKPNKLWRHLKVVA